MGKYGFNDEPAPSEEQSPIDLPKPKAQVAAKPPVKALQSALKAGEKLGFVSREPQPKTQARTPGRRKSPELQDKLLIAGPQRVIEAFRVYCDEENLTSYWAGLEKLLKQK